MASSGHTDSVASAHDAQRPHFERPQTQLSTLAPIVERGLSGEQALVEIAQLRDGIKKRRITSPEMRGQQQFVKDWRVGD